MKPKTIQKHEQELETIEWLRKNTPDEKASEQYATMLYQEQLERTIEEALFDYSHTPDHKAREEYHLIIQTASQDYYTVTGDWYHRKSGEVKDD